MSQNPEENRPVENAKPEDNHGRAEFGTGSTTQGGSNYGQGMHSLPGKDAVNKQGSESNRGSNYNNESEGLGDSTVGSSNEGSQNPQAGAAEEAPFRKPEDETSATTKDPKAGPDKRTNLADDNLM